MLNSSSLLRDVSLSAAVAGFVAVVVGFLSSVAIIFKAAEAAGATQAQISSWLLVLGLGMGLTSIGLSLQFRAPVLTAWSTPGAALLATSAVGTPMSQTIAAFVVSGMLIFLFGVTGWFDRLISLMPKSIASAMVAGILLRFGMNVFTSMETDLVLPMTMLLVYLVMRRLLPRYAIVVTLLAGILVSWLAGFRLPAIELEVSRPVFTMPVFTWQAIIGISFPLFAVTMASQNVPGIATMRASGYNTPVSPIIGWTGLITFVLAPFGCLGVNLAAITAAICMGEDAHENPQKRYIASVSAGVFYILLGVFSATVVAVLAAVPQELVLTIAGLALFATISGSLLTALQNDSEREAALITFLVTASGVSLFGVGAAFWGLVGGISALLVDYFIHPRDRL